MKSWSLGRVNFNIPKSYKINSRAQSIYHVEVNTNPLNGKTASEIWKDKLQKIEKIHSATVKNNEEIILKETNSEFPIVIYKDNPSMPSLITVETQKHIDDNILTLKYQGKIGKEQNILKLLSITSEGYHVGIPYGFNVGAGSITSKPSRNEHATASFIDKNNTELKVSIKTAGAYLNKHPLDDVEYETKGLANDGIILKVIKNEERTVAEFNGYEGIISFDDSKEEPQFRFTWFTSGITADSFNPEILIKAHGPLKNIDSFKTTWEAILKSLKIRKKAQ